MRRNQKPIDVAYVKPAQLPWLGKDDVAKQLKSVNRKFSIADDKDADAGWSMGDSESAIPDLPNWMLLLHNDVYGPLDDASEAVRRKYFGYLPREANVQ